MIYLVMNLWMHFTEDEFDSIYYPPYSVAISFLQYNMGRIQKKTVSRFPNLALAARFSFGAMDIKSPYIYFQSMLDHPATCYAHW